MERQRWSEMSSYKIKILHMKNSFMSKKTLCIFAFFYKCLAFLTFYVSCHKLNSSGVFLISLLNWFIIVFACTAISHRTRTRTKAPLFLHGILSWEWLTIFKHSFFESSNPFNHSLAVLMHTKWYSQIKPMILIRTDPKTSILQFNCKYWSQIQGNQLSMTIFFITTHHTLHCVVSNLLQDDGF